MAGVEENTYEPPRVGGLPLKRTEVSLGQKLNAESPMEVTELGIVTEVSMVQPENVEAPMVVTPVPMTRFVRPEQT